MKLLVNIFHLYNWGFWVWSPWDIKKKKLRYEEKLYLNCVKKYCVPQENLHSLAKLLHSPEKFCVCLQKDWNIVLSPTSNYFYLKSFADKQSFFPFHFFFSCPFRGRCVNDPKRISAVYKISLPEEKLHYNI